MRDRRFNWVYIFGAICPSRGVGAAVVMPTVNVAAMNAHLAAISDRVGAGAIAVLVIDGAGWHRSADLIVPDNIVLLRLPPYAPELNPVENIWEYMRGNGLSHQVWEHYDAIVDATCIEWNKLMALPELIRSIGDRVWAQVKT